MCVPLHAVHPAPPAVASGYTTYVRVSMATGTIGSSSGSQLRDEAGDSKSFANKATAYGVTLLLIWFTFAGVHCMVSMHFKHDTLLYGRSKSD